MTTESCRKFRISPMPVKPMMKMDRCGSYMSVVFAADAEMRPDIDCGQSPVSYIEN